MDKSGTYNIVNENVKKVWDNIAPVGLLKSCHQTAKDLGAKCEVCDWTRVDIEGHITLWARTSKRFGTISHL